MRAFVAKTLLLVASLLVTLVLVELALRVVGYEYHPMQVETGSKADARVYHLFGDENFVYDPQLIWRPKAGFGVFNSKGFRGAEPGARNGKLRIATVGDSNTLGWSGEEGANWPLDLEEQLTAGGRPTEVVNAGVWGYSSHQGVTRTREALELDPDLVLISFGSNDAHHVTRSDAEFSSQSQGGRRLVRAVQRLRLAQLWIAFLDRFGPQETELRPRVSDADYRANLETMIADVRAAGSLPVLLTRPYTGPVIHPTRWKFYAPRYNQATLDVAEEQSVLAVDVYSFFKGMDELFADESHFTDQGHELAAAIVLEHLRPWLGRPAGDG